MRRFSAFILKSPLSRCSRRLEDILLPRDSIVHREGGRLNGNEYPQWREVDVDIHTFLHQGLQGYAFRGGEGGLLTTSLYHLRIQTHTSLTRWGSDASKDYMALSASTSFLFRSIWRPARIYQLSCRTVRLAPSQRAVTLASIDAQVLSEIHACCTLLRRGGLRGLGIFI